PYTTLFRSYSIIRFQRLCLLLAFIMSLSLRPRLRLQLNACAARVELRERDGETAHDVNLTEQGAGGGALQGGHVAVGDEVSFQFGKIHQQVWIAEADADERRFALDQFGERARAGFGQRAAIRLPRADAAVHRDDNKISFL